MRNKTKAMPMYGLKTHMYVPLKLLYRNKCTQHHGLSVNSIEVGVQDEPAHHRATGPWLATYIVGRMGWGSSVCMSFLLNF